MFDELLIKKIKKLKISNVIFFILLVFLYSCIFIFFLIRSENEVNALSGDYSTRGAGDPLTPTDWNYLDEDFLTKDSNGDTMNGDLNMGGNIITNLPASLPANTNFIANVGFVNLISGSGASDRNGNPKKMICGATTPGSTGWVSYFGDIRADVNTSDLGGNPNFSSVPKYIISLGGINVDFQTGSNAIYLPSTAGFRVYLKTGVSPTEAENRGWIINWCGVGT